MTGVPLSLFFPLRALFSVTQFPFWLLASGKNMVHSDHDFISDSSGLKKEAPDLHEQGSSALGVRWWLNTPLLFPAADSSAGKR